MYDLNIDGFMEELELIQIAEWAELVPQNGIIVEIGSYKGRSSYAWATSCHSSVTVFCFDQRHEQGDEFSKNTQHIKNIVPIKSYVPYNMNNWNVQPVDVFFLDGTHSNPQDIDAINYFIPLLKQGGLLCGHDYYPDTNNCPDIISNVRHLEERFNSEVYHPNGTSLWAFRL